MHCVYISGALCTVRAPIFKSGPYIYIGARYIKLGMYLGKSGPYLYIRQRYINRAMCTLFGTFGTP